MVRSRHRAFTLIELLVVIALIAILAAILFPVFAQVREKARQANCVSSLGQINRALLIYAQDYDETLPRIRFRIIKRGGAPGPDYVALCDPKSEVLTWKGAIQPYVKSYDFWKCPSNPRKGLPGEDVDKNISISYAVNPMAFRGWDHNDKTPSRTLASFAEPATTLQLLESTAACPDLGDWVGYWGANASGKGGMCGPDGMSGINWVKFQTHSGTLNWGFMDGHVKSMKYRALWEPGLTPPYHDMWGTWEDDSMGKPDRGQITSGARARRNVANMCLYLR